MTTDVDLAVVEPAVARPERDGIDLAEAGFLDWIDRAIALTTLGTGVAAIVFATSQLAELPWPWLMVVTGSLVGSSLVMPFYAWSQRGVRIPATMLAISVMVGLWTWPLAWQGGVADEAPWLWPCIGVSTVVLSIAWGNTVALVHNLFCSAAYLVARMAPSGGFVDEIVAMQDTLIVAVQPALILALFGYVRRQASQLDAWVKDARRQKAEADLRGTLVAQRNQLDAIIHDEVMTTLVAAARSSDDRSTHVTDLARHAIASLEAQASEDSTQDAFPPSNVLRLITDVVASVSSSAQVVDRVDRMAPFVPNDVIRTVASAVREAVLNAEKHAQSDAITVTVTIEGAGRAVRVAVDVVDDGVGFDPANIPGRRLGVRLSLRERLRSVGGTAEVTSAPGRGSLVAMEWSGTPGVREGSVPGGETTSMREHPVLGKVAMQPIGYACAAAVALFSTVGVLQLVDGNHTIQLLISFACVLVAAPLALTSFGRTLSLWRALVISAATLTLAWLNSVALPAGGWAPHGAWFVGVLCLMVVLLRAGSQRVLAWVVAVGCAAVVMTAAWIDNVSILQHLSSALNPMGWLVMVEMLIVWIRRVQRDLDVAQRDADESSSASATAFARLVVREVWLADVVDQVGDMLHRLADPAARITDADKEACLAMEGRLRDGIMAANFSTPSLSGAIMEARLRGVQVTLVDNRGGRLPESVRKETLTRLERTVRGATVGRIVARAAPEGYAEAVTIVRVDEHGSVLTRIDNDGTVQVNAT